MSGGGNLPAKETLAGIVDKAFADINSDEKIGRDNLKHGFYEWTSPKWISGNVMTTSIDPSWIWADEDEDGEGIDGYWSVSKEDVKKATDKLDTALKGQISKSSVIKQKLSGETWNDGDEEIEHFNYQVITTFNNRMSGGGKTGDDFFGKKKYFFSLSEAEDVWDPKLWNTLGKYIMKHLKESNPDNIYFMDNQDDIRWMLDVKTKVVNPGVWSKGVDNGFMEVVVGKNVVGMNDEGFEAVYFTDKSKASFEWIKHEDDNKWIKWSKSQIDAENGEDYDVTLYDVWVNPKDGEQFYKIEKIDQEDEYVVMGELGDMGEELIEEYSTLAKARARAKELVRIAEGKKMSGGGNVFKGKQEYFYDLGEYGELWDDELDGLMNFLQKHLKVEPDDILVMDNQGEMEWELDVKLKRVPNSQWAPGIKTLDSAEVKSAPGIVTFSDHSFHAVYFTKNSEKSFAFIQFENEI
jgi:hypothetical protein